MIPLLAAATLLLAGEAAAEEGRRSVLQQLLPAAADDWVRMEVMEADERQFFFDSAYKYTFDLDVMVERLREMAADCPGAGDVHRLPPLADCRRNYTLASAALDRLWLEYGLSGPVEQAALAEVIADQRWRKEVWGHLWDCRGNYGSCGRRVWLQRLRSLVGRPCYDRAEWPEPVLGRGR